MTMLYDPTTGAMIPVDLGNMTHVYTYGGPNGAIDTDTVTFGSLQFRKTYTYTGSNMTGESAWVKV